MGTYKIDEKEFEEIIKSIALNNETLIENNDPVLIFYTMSKFIFNKYAINLEEEIDRAAHKQKEIIEEFKICFEEELKIYNQELKKTIELIHGNMHSYDKNIKSTLVSKFDKLVQEVQEKDERIYNNSLYIKLLIATNIVISLLLLYLIF